MIKAIVAVDSKWGIGRNNDLLFHLPEDMKFFRQTTQGKTVVMGSNTLLSFPNGKPLPNRRNIVLWPNAPKRDDCEIVESLEELKLLLSSINEDVYVIGGAMFYRTMLVYCSEVLVTKVQADGNAEVFFENLDDKKEWECISSSEPIETGGYTIIFTTYKNNDVQLLRGVK